MKPVRTHAELAVRWSVASEVKGGGRPPAADLERFLAVGAREAVAPSRCAEIAAAVLAARADWTEDFDGEQYTLGRAFYTHLEQERSRAYFAGARDSDALVERHLPGFQAELRALFAELAGGAARPRRGFCGPGVHVFPPERPVARRGGVVHADIEGLTDHQVRRGTPALTLVVSIRAPAKGGGLRLWDARYEGTDALRARDVRVPHLDVEYAPGDALLFDSRRVHRILPFEGSDERITATVHGAAVDAGQWETWF